MPNGTQPRTNHLIEELHLARSTQFAVSSSAPVCNRNVQSRLGPCRASPHAECRLTFFFRGQWGNERRWLPAAPSARLQQATSFSSSAAASAPHLYRSLALRSHSFRRRVFRAGWAFTRLRPNSSHARESITRR